LDAYDIKKTYGLTGTEVNTIATKAASALSNLVKTKALDTKNINEDIYATACDIVLNLYFGTTINTTDRDFADKIQNEIVRNAYAKNQEKMEKEAKMLTDFDFKQKQIASLGNNAGYQTYRKDFYDPYLKGRENRTTDAKEYYDIISQDRLNQLIKDRAQSDGLSAKYPKLYGSLSTGGRGLPDVDKVNFINQFYIDKPSHENRGTLDKLLTSQHPDKSYKEQK
jgi:hypothetical protein